jgi:CxxC motif-containing protein (DUF1111 family)
MDHRKSVNVIILVTDTTGENLIIPMNNNTGTINVSMGCRRFLLFECIGCVEKAFMTNEVIHSCVQYTYI